MENTSVDRRSFRADQFWFSLNCGCWKLKILALKHWVFSAEQRRLSTEILWINFYINTWVRISNCDNDVKSDENAWSDAKNGNPAMRKMWIAPDFCKVAAKCFRINFESWSQKKEKMLLKVWSISVLLLQQSQNTQKVKFLFYLWPVGRWNN